MKPPYFVIVFSILLSSSVKLFQNPWPPLARLELALLRDSTRLHEMNSHKAADLQVKFQPSVPVNVNFTQLHTLYCKKKRKKEKRKKRST